MPRKIFISIPMRGRDDVDVKNELNSIMNKYFPNDILIDTMIIEPKSDIHCIGSAISLMDEADLVVFAPGYENSRGCLVEKIIAERYGKDIFIIDLKENYRSIANVMKCTTFTVRELVDRVNRFPANYNVMINGFDTFGIDVDNDYGFISLDRELYNENGGK